MASQYAQLVKEIVPEAGEIIMSHRNRGESVVTKEKNEIVTPADIAANDYIVTKLRETNISIYSEEGSKNRSEDSTRWIVDPLDGTTPWVWGNSGFSVSIALEQDEKIVLGAVYDPVMKELFFAEEGAGATKNNQPIKVVTGIPIQDTFMVVDWGNQDDKRQEGLTYFRRFFLPEMFAKRIVPQFAPALGLCRIAEGRIHALVCNDTWVEDHVAGSLIVKEAGGQVSNFYSTEGFDVRQSGIVASNEQTIHDALTQFLRADK